MKHNRVRDVPHDQHARAFLEHYAHASEIVILFLAYAGVANANISRGFKLIVLTRFDGDVIRPEEDALIFGRSGDAMLPPVDLRLFNNTGTGTSGFHYDPVHMRQNDPRRGQVARRIAEAARQSEKTPRLN